MRSLIVGLLVGTITTTAGTVGPGGKFDASANGARDTLSSGTKAETVTSGASCVCSSETANAVHCSVSTTTLTITGTGTDAFNYWCNK